MKNILTAPKYYITFMLHLKDGSSLPCHIRKAEGIYAYDDEKWTASEEAVQEYIMLLTEDGVYNPETCFESLGIDDENIVGWSEWK